MLHMISAQCVACDLHTIAPRPLEHTCWRRFAGSEEIAKNLKLHLWMRLLRAVLSQLNAAGISNIKETNCQRSWRLKLGGLNFLQSVFTYSTTSISNVNDDARGETSGSIWQNGILLSEEYLLWSKCVQNFRAIAVVEAEKQNTPKLQGQSLPPPLPPLRFGVASSLLVPSWTKKDKGTFTVAMKFLWLVYWQAFWFCLGPPLGTVVNSLCTHAYLVAVNQFKLAWCMPLAFSVKLSHTQTHTHVCTHTHTHAHMYTQTDTLTYEEHVHMGMHVCACVCVYTHTHTHTLFLSFSELVTQLTDTHSCVHSHTHTCTHVHTHSIIFWTCHTAVHRNLDLKGIALINIFSCPLIIRALLRYTLLMQLAEPGIHCGNEDSRRNENRRKNIFCGKTNQQEYFFLNSPSV